MILKKKKISTPEKPEEEKIRNPKGAGRKPTGRRRRVFYLTDRECEDLRKVLTKIREVQDAKKRRMQND